MSETATKNPTIYTVREVAEILGTSPSYVYHNWKKWAFEERRISVMVIAGRPKFKASEVNKLIKSFEV